MNKYMATIIAGLATNVAQAKDKLAEFTEQLNAIEKLISDL